MTFSKAENVWGQVTNPSKLASPFQATIQTHGTLEFGALWPFNLASGLISEALQEGAGHG
jgi:hypothetical protein